jgi:hypothetical protein
MIVKTNKLSLRESGVKPFASQAELPQERPG